MQQLRGFFAYGTRSLRPLFCGSSTPKPTLIEPGAFVDRSRVIATLEYNRLASIATGRHGLTINDAERDGQPGLEIEIEYAPYGVARDLAERIRCGAFSGLGVVFKPIEVSYRDELRIVKAAVLEEVAICLQPVFPDTSIELLN